MRISLSRKILIIYSLLLSFSLVQGGILYLVVEEFRSYNTLKELVMRLKSQVHVLEDLKDKVFLNVEHEHDVTDEAHQGDHQHYFFDEEYEITQDVLVQLSTSDKKQITKHASLLNDTGIFLANYRRAYFELHNLIHKEQLIHNQANSAFSQLQGRFAELEPGATEKLFFLLLNHYAIESNIFRDHSIDTFPQLQELKSELALLTGDQIPLAVIQDVINLNEKDYLNSLAIIDRQTFLEDSAAHLADFCDSITTDFAKQINQYQTRLKWLMLALIGASVFITLLLYSVSRKYFKKFLGGQEAAITAIGKGEYDYPLQALPKDELGDLAIFMKGMSKSLEQSYEKIRRNEKHVRLLLNSASEAIYGLDIEGKCTFCNNSFLRLMGYESDEELLGKNVHDLIHHTRKDGSSYPWDECVAHRGFLEGKQTHSADEMFWRKDGSSFYAECWSHPIMQDGLVTGAVTTFIDITKRRDTQHALRNSEELYRTLIENIDLGITLIDKDHTVIMTNSAQGRLFGRDPLSFNGQKCFQEFERRDQICSHCPGVTAMDTGHVQETFANGIKDDGSTFTVRIKAFPVIREEGKIFGFIEVVEDVTVKLQAEQDLAAEKEQLSVTLRSIGDGVITTDVEGQVVLLNKVAEQLCGWDQEEAQGKPLTEVFQIINEVTGAPCENPVDKVIATGQTVDLANHTALIARDGTQRSIADSGAAIRDRESKIIGVVLVFRDVTDENIRDKELLKTKKLESIGVLAGGIAHDFNNILSAVLGNINLVRHIISPSERKAHSLLEEAEKASIRAKNLTHQLLTFSKGGEPVKETASLIDIVLDSTAFVLRGTDIKYEYDIPEDLWPVEVDSGQISQVIQNIVLNARHAMPSGGVLQINCMNVSPEMDKPVVLQKNRKFVMVNITDTGIGIPAKVIESIFDPYFTTKTEGSGLGLSICHSIIDKHHGFISVDSEQGTGTTFTFYLPASHKLTAEKEVAHHEKVYAKKGLKVLIMDDDEQIRTIADAMLMHLGCETYEAGDGAEAIELYKSSMKEGNPIDVVIMDLTIPGGMGGKEAVAEILKLNSGAKVVVSSGYSNDPVMANHKKYGFCDAIIKPYQLKELAKAIDKVMAS